MEKSFGEDYKNDIRLDLKVTSTTSNTEPVAGTFTEVGEVTRTGIIWTLTRQGRGLCLTGLAEVEVEEEKYESGDNSAGHASCAEQCHLCYLLLVTHAYVYSEIVALL